MTLPAAVGRGETAQWLEPALDTWMYTNSTTSGSREFGPTFNGLDVDTQTNEFFAGSDEGPARLGMTMVAFETNDQIDAGIDPAQYVINSVTVNVWATRTGTGDLIYSEQPITPASVLAEALTGTIGSQQPVELFGVGFTGGFTGFDLGLNSGGGSAFFSEATEPYDGPTGPYVVYPVVGDGQGGYSDVSNNLSGGFSVTAPGQQTAPFDAPAWAIGDGFSVDTNDIEDPGTPYSEGAILPLITRYEFSLDLAKPGVEDYVRQGLSDGALGFILSSVHSGGQPGVPGGGAYIDWRMKEAFADFSARLEVDFEIVDSPPGDFDGDGDVDVDDFGVFVGSFQNSPEGGPPFAQGDFDEDGDVDVDDFGVFVNSFQMFPPAGSAIAIPEPSTGGYALIALTTAAFCWGTHAFTAVRPRREGEW